MVAGSNPSLFLVSRDSCVALNPCYVPGIGARHKNDFLRESLKIVESNTRWVWIQRASWKINAEKNSHF